MYFDEQNQNLIFISVSRNRKLSIIRKTMHFPDYRGFPNQVNKKSTSAVHLLINSDVLLPPAAKKGGINKFFRTKAKLWAAR